MFLFIFTRKLNWVFFIIAPILYLYLPNSCPPFVPPSILAILPVITDDMIAFSATYCDPQ